MRTAVTTLLILTPLASGLPAAGQSAAASDPSDARARMQASVSRQVASASRMTASIGRQRTAVQGQMQRASSGFFDTPAPSALRSTLLPPCDPLPPVNVDSLIRTASNREGVDGDLIRDVMKQESGFRPCAVSDRGAMGLMQLMPATAADLAVTDPFDPQENVTAGAKYLRRLMSQFGGDVALTLAAYNAGPARVATGMAVPRIPETLDYVQNILGLFTKDKEPGISEIEKGSLIIQDASDAAPLGDGEE